MNDARTTHNPDTRVKVSHGGGKPQGERTGRGMEGETKHVTMELRWSEEARMKLTVDQAKFYSPFDSLDMIFHKR